jgi:hypothetical protein
MVVVVPVSGDPIAWGRVVGVARHTLTIHNAQLPGKLRGCASALWVLVEINISADDC